MRQKTNGAMKLSSVRGRAQLRDFITLRGDSGDLLAATRQKRINHTGGLNLGKRAQLIAPSQQENLFHGVLFSYLLHATHINKNI